MEEKKEDALHPEAQFDAAFDAEPVQEPEASKEEGQLPSEETPERDAEENEQPAALSPDGKSEPDPDDELRKKAHGYDSMKGRLNQEQKRRLELEAEVERLRAQAQPPAPKPEQAAAPAENKAALDENMQALVNALPENLRGVFHEESADGTRLRKVLDEFGPEQASILAEVVLERRTEHSARQERETSRAEEVKSAHFATLSEKFPDFTGAFSGDAVQLRVLRDGIEDFIGHLPYAEGVRFSRIAKEGTTEEVTELLEKYAAYRSGPGSGTGTQKKVAQAAQDGYAVPTRSVPPLNKNVPPDDFDSAFDEAVKSQR